MVREDDFRERRRHLERLDLEALEARFWEIARRLAAPLLELARSHTSPSVERSVLLRMGLSSQESAAVVEAAARRGRLGAGAGGLVLGLAQARGVGLRQAGRLLAAGEGWDEAAGALAALSRRAGGLGAEGRPRDGGSGGCCGVGAAPEGACRQAPDTGLRRGSARDGPLQPDRPLDPRAVLDGLAGYRPRPHPWGWRRAEPGLVAGPFQYRQASAPLRRSVEPPAAGGFGGIDPQPDCLVSVEIASGRFEDDLRRMRMAAWHGADHIMVIRTAGQSHVDGLLEGTPEGVAGVPITRKQLRATRRALDLIEEEVGRPLYLHSYVSGLASPEMAVLFAEEGVSGAHQDPQYNILYRNINPLRSFVDAAEAKAVMARAGLLQIDGAHNANATARQAWKVMPELLVQHAINCQFSLGAGLSPEMIALSTVPTTVPPAPCLWLDLPYAALLRRLFRGFRFRAQMNTRYITSDARAATVAHVLNLLVTRLVGADIQSTITPDEGRHLPWHHNSVAAVDTAREALVGLDGLRELVGLRWDGPLGRRARELLERAVLFLEEAEACGGYLAALARGFFVDSGFYPAREGDGIARPPEGGVAAGSVVRREPGYLAPVCGHFPAGPGPGAGGGRGAEPCRPWGGCTLCRPERAVWVEEPDPADSVEARLDRAEAEAAEGRLVPEVQWRGDGVVTLSAVFPAPTGVARRAAVAAARRLGLLDPEVVHAAVLHPAEGALVEVRGVLPFALSRADLPAPETQDLLGEEEILSDVRSRPFTVVAATAGQDEHSVGLREILDVKHGGLERYGFGIHYLGTSVPVDRLVDAAEETGADAILISTVLSHAGVHRLAMRRLHQACVERGLRERLLLVAGGPQVSQAIAREEGLDAGFGRGTRGHEVASFLVLARRRGGGRSARGPGPGLAGP
ncbi:MAG: cobalamin-dependent protein [Acetobacteraceae bacterium]|nr:cobalamin-dependent protein [Acetobacteraceae bacterium]